MSDLKLTHNEYSDLLVVLSIKNKIGLNNNKRFKNKIARNKNSLISIFNKPSTLSVFSKIVLAHMSIIILQVGC